MLELGISLPTSWILNWSNTLTQLVERYWDTVVVAKFRLWLRICSLPQRGNHRDWAHTSTNTQHLPLSRTHYFCYKRYDDCPHPSSISTSTRAIIMFFRTWHPNFSPWSLCMCCYSPWNCWDLSAESDQCTSLLSPCDAVLLYRRNITMAFE